MKTWPMLVLVLVMATATVAGCRKPTLQSSGGYVLKYRLADGEQVEPELMAAAMQQRLVGASLDKATVRVAEDGEFVVELPAAEVFEVEMAKKFLRPSGHLAFRIVADKKLDERIVEAALAGSAQDTESVADGSSFAWARLDPESTPVEDWMVVRDIESGEKEVLTLVSLDDVMGHELQSAMAGRDELLRPCIIGSLNSEGARKMQLLTSANIKRHLGIIWDGQLLSCPMVQSAISTHLQITGRFEEEEVHRIVTILKSGTLPARLDDIPVSEKKVSPP
jgi:preprotein translocase subunit SecD